MRNVVASTTLLAASCLVWAVAPIGGDAPSSSAAVTQISPLANYLGFGYHPDQEDAVYAQEEGERQDLIASCMSREGFQYWARPLDADPSAAEPAPKDPNDEYRRSLSTEESGQYWLALTGRERDEDGITSSEMARIDDNGDGHIDFDERADMGCLGYAEHEMPGVYRIVGVLRDEIAAMEANVREDPGTTAAQGQYVLCMNALGLQGTTLDEVRTSLIDSAFADNPVVIDTSKCETALDSAMAPIRLSAEVQFYEANKEVIERVAYPAK